MYSFNYLPNSTFHFNIFLTPHYYKTADSYLYKIIIPKIKIMVIEEIKK